MSDKKENIALVIDSFGNGGIQQAYRSLLKYYANVYKSVFLVVVSRSDDELNVPLLPNIYVKRLESSRLADVRNIINLKKILSEIEPDVIIASIYRTQLWTSLVKPKQSQLIWWEQNVYTHRSIFLWGLMRLVLFKVNSVISVCNEGADLFEKYTKLRPTVIPNPMTFKVTKDLELKRYDDFIFVGRLIDQKNPELLLRSFALFKNLFGLQSKLHIVGDGYLLPKLKQLSKTLDVEEDCLFHGWVDNKDIHNLLKGAKTLLSTSRSGGMEIVRLEALASGCAVVTTNTGGTHFFETNSDIGFIISEPNPDSFSLGMKQSLDKKYWKKSQISLRCSFIDKFKVDIIGPLIINSLQTKSKL